MADDDLHQQITALVHEEHELSSESTAPERQARRKAIEEQLDQLWDLLRQRDARRTAGADPAGAEERPAEEVESYLQ
jgi:hypothetical protein